MTDDKTVRLAMRGRLLALVVCTTGATALSATAIGYARVAGSFIDDGFEPGMEVMPAGFAQNATPGVVKEVTALALKIDGGCSVEAAAGGRTLSVGLPRVRSYANLAATDNGQPTNKGFIAGRPFAEERYVPGPANMGGIGPNARVFAEPLYLVRVGIPEGLGDEAALKYSRAVLNLYPPSDILPLANGDSIHIKGNPAPFPGQVLPTGTGHAAVLCTIPARCHSLNTI